MLLRPLKFAPQLLRLSATPLSLPSRSLLTKSSATQSPVLSVPRVLKRSITRSAPTLTSRRPKLPLPRLLRLPLRSNVTPRWLPSASQPQDTDTTATDTTTARRLPRRLAIMFLLSPLLSQLLYPYPGVGWQTVTIWVSHCFSKVTSTVLAVVASVF